MPEEGALMIAFARGTSCAVVLLVACVAVAQERTDFIRGAYSDPKPFWDTGARLDEYGINAVFVAAARSTKS
jgi:hypothetical protein